MKLEGQVRIPSGCAIAAVIAKDGEKMSGEMIVNAMKPMHDRSNGLGGGFAAYGIYPEYRDYYAFHIFFDSRDTRKTCEALLKEGFEIVKAEHIPIRQIPEITDVPLIWRYFLAPMQSVLNRLQLDAEEYVARIVTKINAELRGAYVFSSGKNMGTFKAVGYPEDVGRFYRLEEYEAYCDGVRVWFDPGLRWEEPGTRCSLRILYSQYEEESCRQAADLFSWYSRERFGSGNTLSFFLARDGEEWKIFSLSGHAGSAEELMRESMVRMKRKIRPGGTVLLSDFPEIGLPEVCRECRFVQVCSLLREL